MTNEYLMHYGVKGMKWGVRRYVGEDGYLTPEGERHYYAQKRDREKKEREKSKNYRPRSKRARSYYQQSKHEGYDDLDAKTYARNMVRSQNTALAVLGGTIATAVAYKKYGKKARQAVSRALNTKVKRGVVAGAVGTLAAIGFGALVKGSREAGNKSLAYSAQQDVLENYEKANPGSTKTPKDRQAILDKHYGYR